MKTDRNKRLGRESLDRAKALLSMSDKDRPWTPFNFVADDCYNRKDYKTLIETLTAVNSMFVVKDAIYKMMRG